MKGIIATLAFAALLVNVYAKDIKFEECSDVKGVVQKVDVEPCTEEPCRFKKGETVKMSATVKPKEKVEAGKLSVTISMEGIELEYPGIEPDICKKVSCPVEAGQEVTAQYDITAEDFFPDMLIDMKWEAKDSNDKTIFCALAKVGIES